MARLTNPAEVKSCVETYRRKPRPSDLVLSNPLQIVEEKKSASEGMFLLKLTSVSEFNHLEHVLFPVLAKHKKAS